MKSLFVALFLAVSLWAVDYSEMSNQELLAIIGYVPDQNLPAFKKEIESRVPTMSDKEKKVYEQNRHKLKK